MDERLDFTVLESESGMRADAFVVLKAPELSRAYVQSLIEDGCVLVSGAPVKKSRPVMTGERVKLELPVAREYEALPEDIGLDIVYEDDFLAVVDKPKGMVVHPAAGNLSGTLVNALLFHCKGKLSGINGVMRPGIVHRIDKDTSGLLVVAKTDEAHRSLAQQLSEHSMTRVYYAVIQGTLPEELGVINAPIGRSQSDRKKMAVTEHNSKNAVTHYETLECFRGFSYVKFRLETGRTHQIRVHMAYKGHPVAGDTVYGAEKQREFDGQCLHAGVLGFVHPHSGEYVEFHSDNPPYFEMFLKKLRGTATEGYAED